MKDKRVLTIQDISCVGQCSLTVALPIISACGLETCILPSAVLSTHTGGFTGYTFRDLAEDIPLIAAHWKKEGIAFDALYTGYLGSEKQIDYVLDIMHTLLLPGAWRVIDPAMADAGKLYPGFDLSFVHAMARLCAQADIVLPNITEACFLTDTAYPTDSYDEAFVRSLCEKLCAAGAKQVVLTGVSYEPSRLGVAIYQAENKSLSYYFHEKIAKSSHGTGDVYAAAFTGALLRGKSVEDAARIAADYTVLCIHKTEDDPDHFYGVKFEKAIPDLVKALAD